MSSEAGTDSVERPNGYTYQPSRIYGDGPAAIEVGVERVTGRRYLRTAMLHRNGEFDEYRGIDLHEFNAFLAEPDAAVTFADNCQRGDHANRWLPPPAWPACTPIREHRRHLAGKRATLLTDHPTDAAGRPVTGFPAGTAFVRIISHRVRGDGNLAVQLLDSDVTFLIDAQQLGLR